MDRQNEDDGLIGEARLKKMLEAGDAPPDENARKRAVNLALAAFDGELREKEKKSQGFSILGRLMDKSASQQRRMSMSKRKVFGGMATAMVVILVSAVSVQQMRERSDSTLPLKEAPDGTDISLATTAGAPAGRSMHPGVAPKPVAGAGQGARQQTVARRADTGAADMAMGGIAMEAAPMTNAKSSFSTLAAKPGKERMAQGMIQDMTQGMTQGRAVPAAPAIAIAPADMPPPAYYQDSGRDQFRDFEENAVRVAAQEPVSTFSIDVDTASYAFARRQLNHGALPQKDAVRIEEMINYFDYDYPLPEAKDTPFRPSVTVLPSPWKEGNKLIHIGIKGYDIADDAPQPRSNLVFLLDTSGSMNAPDKLPLVVNSLKLLLARLKPEDRIAIVTYAGYAGTVLEPTRVAEKDKIVGALERLYAGGSTAGAEGIRQAYRLAEENFDKDAVNRVILATDGDFNVGITNPEELKDFVERKRETGIYLSVLGFGQGNLNDRMMQELAQNGNGVAAYIDSLNEARKVLSDEATSTLFPIAKDVKIQVEFNPATVAEYRLIGYETRALNREDFNNDAVDAGDIGAGHAVTAIYEITPAGSGGRMVDESRYGAPAVETRAMADFGDEYAFLKIRYKLPEEDTSRLITTPITAADEPKHICPPCPPNVQCAPCAGPVVAEQNFAVAVAAFGQILKGGKYTGGFTYDDVISLAQANKGEDEYGYRAEFINLVRLAKNAAAMARP